MSISKNDPMPQPNSPGMKDIPRLIQELKKNSIEFNISEKKINRMLADIEVIAKIDLKNEANEFRKKALYAKIAEMEAQIESEKVKMEILSFNVTNLHNTIESILGFEPEIVLPYSRMPLAISYCAPEQFFLLPPRL